MPRAFTFRLSNQTPFPLLRVGEPSLDGDWTPKPPQRIEPHEEVEWGTTSDSVARGTAGSVFYEIDLAKSGALPTDGAGIDFKWSVPFLGSPDFEFAYLKRSDVLAADDRSKEFQLVPTFSSEAGSESAEDFAAAAFLGPVSLLHANHPSISAAFRLRPGSALHESRLGLTVEIPLLPPTALTAVSHPLPAMWSGVWTDTAVSGSRLAVTVDAGAAGFDLTAREFSGTPATATAVRPVSERLPAYGSGVWPAPPIAKKPVDKVVHMPKLDVSETVKPAPARPTIIRPILKGNDVLALGDHVRLALYEEKTVSGSDHVRFRLRYLSRTGGTTRIDAMLMPFTPIK